MPMESVHTDAAPKAVGPYSQAVKFTSAGASLVYTAGQVALDPATGKLVPGGVGAETVQVLANLSAVLCAAGSGLDRVVKTTVFLADMADFQAMNSIYAEAFAGHRPARSTVQVAALPLGARVEIEAVALA
jgi:2-iminobutanoate/2-iminopropanoate deaminase